MTFTYQQHINGAWTGAASGGTWKVINPATEEVVRSVPFGGREDCHTAIEAAVDAVVTSYHPLVKVAKDVAAGAVLIAAACATAIAYLVLYGRLTEPGRNLLRGVRQAPTHVVLIALAVTVLAAIAIKAYVGRGTPLRGGFPSGHAAVAFAGWMAITIVVAPWTHAALVSTLAFMMALLVAQSRVEAGIHSAVETVAGAMLGAGVTLILFQIWG